MQKLIPSLREHGKSFPDEENLSARMIAFLEKNQEKSFHNWHWDDGHITASMLIVNEDFTKVLLILHKKLKRWLQFGGHSDDSPDVLGTAIREFHEESGILEEPEIFSYYEASIVPIFDLDIHSIPADAKGRPNHLHYDIRFLGIISDSVLLTRQEEEVDDMRWFTLEEAEKIVAEEGLLRIFSKIRQIKNG